MPTIRPKTAGGDSSAILPIDDEGRLYHLGIRRGEASNRIITVGDPRRARTLALYLDGAASAPQTKELSGVFHCHSERGFVTYTGTYKGIPISIISIGMGFANMDFMVRELREITNGPLAILRFGSCGGIREEAHIGQLAISDGGSLVIQRNFEYQFNSEERRDSDRPPYLISPLYMPEPTLTNLLKEKAKNMAEEGLLLGKNGSADSFYSSQGRATSSFYDANEDLIADLIRAGIATLEMETGHLFHLAQCTKDPQRPIWASAIHVVVADRPRNAFLIDRNDRDRLDVLGARICLETLAALDMSDYAVTRPAHAGASGLGHK